MTEHRGGQTFAEKMVSARLTVLDAVAGVHFRVALEVQQGGRGSLHREVIEINPANGGVGSVVHLLVLHATDEVAPAKKNQVIGRIRPAAAVGNPKRVGRR